MTESSLNIENISKIVKKDFVIILLCLLVVLFCVYTLYAVQSYKVECNNHWASEINKSPCMRMCVVDQFDMGFEWSGDYENKNKD